MEMLCLNTCSQITPTSFKVKSSFFSFCMRSIQWSSSQIKKIIMRIKDTTIEWNDFSMVAIKDAVLMKEDS